MRNLCVEELDSLGDSTACRFLLALCKHVCFSKDYQTPLRIGEQQEVHVGADLQHLAHRVPSSGCASTARRDCGDDLKVLTNRIRIKIPAR
jgi:hypothetical protein